jgi:transcription initiation factor TFIIIB Brf1 subunit/transcription initiation factor TFIIB
MVLIAYSIYRGMMEENVARSAQEILYMTGVELSEIYAVEKAMNANIINFTTSEDFVERFAIQCGLTFNDVKHLRNKCKLANEICENFAPQTIASSLIYMYDKNLSVHSISRICLVSASSIHKAVKKLNTALRFHEK